MENHNKKNRGVQHFNKLEKRLQRAIEGGRFFSFAKAKQQQLFRRLQGYSLQLKRAVKPVIVTACLTLGLSGAAFGQITFAEQTGVSNPFNGVDVGTQSIPAFVDIDGDGDMDCFVGDYYGNGLSFFRNTGTSTNPTFVQETGTSNPLDGTINYGYGGTAPAFVDIDGDNDIDAFVGIGDSIVYFKNNGTAVAPNLVRQSLANNPLSSVAVLTFANLKFKDFDNDGDKDAIVGFGGNASNGVRYFRNIGTSTNPSFSELTGVNNPLNAVAVIGADFPAPVDLDGDGDWDVFVGMGDGKMDYYKNTGTITAPVFTQQIGTTNPLLNLDAGDSAAPDFIDIDNDGDLDLFIGENTGVIKFFLNTTVVPIKRTEKENNELEIYPNPSSGYLNFKEPVTGVVTIYNMLGVAVLRTVLNNKMSMTVDDLMIGNYVFELQTDMTLSKVLIIVQ